jgi:hypothetical protein
LVICFDSQRLDPGLRRDDVVLMASPEGESRIPAVRVKLPDIHSAED